MKLVKATTADIPLIRRIVDETWPVAYGSILSEAQISYMINLFYSNEALEKQFNAGHQCLLVFDGDEAVGFAGFDLMYRPDIAKLHKLYVLPNMQGKGIGIVLLNAVVQAATDVNCEALVLNVNRYNKALEFYNKEGFHIVREEDINIGEGYFMNDYVMAKQLPNTLSKSLDQLLSTLAFLI